MTDYQLLALSLIMCNAVAYYKGKPYEQIVFLGGALFLIALDHHH